MIRKQLLKLVLATLTLGGCIKTKPVTLVGENLHLVSVDKRASKYVEVSCQVKEDQKVEIFAVRNAHPMYGDVIIGDYTFKNNHIKLPKIGSFETKQTAEGFELYAGSKLKYILTKKSKPYILSSAAERQQQLAYTVN